MTAASKFSHTEVTARIGQIGRYNTLISKGYGNRLKIGAVLTKIPLVEDVPVDFGMFEFCQACDKCAWNCPAKVNSFKRPEILNWDITVETPWYKMYVDVDDTSVVLQ